MGKYRWRYELTQWMAKKNCNRSMFGISKMFMNFITFGEWIHRLKSTLCNAYACLLACAFANSMNELFNEQNQWRNEWRAFVIFMLRINIFFLRFFGLKCKPLASLARPVQSISKHLMCSLVLRLRCYYRQSARGFYRLIEMDIFFRKEFILLATAWFLTLENIFVAKDVDAYHFEWQLLNYKTHLCLFHLLFMLAIVNGLLYESRRAHFITNHRSS